MATFVEPKEVAELLRAIDGFKGSFTVQCALRIAPMLFVRPGELRTAKWADIDLMRAMALYGKQNQNRPLGSSAETGSSAPA